MKTVLVTGANGQLGKKIKDFSGKYSNWDFIFTDVEQIDISDYNALRIFFESTQIDAVINCAAYTNVDQAEDDDVVANKINAEGPGYLARLCNEHKAVFIHISTDYVFSGNAIEPYNESSITDPISVYGISKLAGEKNVLENYQESIIIRTSWLYSEYGKNFLLTILKYAVERDHLKVVFDQIGTPTYAGDLASGVLDILLQIFEKKVTNYAGIYHYSNLGVCSWYDFAVYILRQKNIKTPILAVDSSMFPTKAVRPKNSLLDKTKIIKQFKIKIPYWTESCREMLLKV